MKKPQASRKQAKRQAPVKSGGASHRKGVRATGSPVLGPGQHPHQPHHGHQHPHQGQHHQVHRHPQHQPPHHHKRVQPKKPVKRKLSLGDVSCCSAEALAASLRLAGVPVGDEDVLALYWHTASDADAGATLSETLEAAAECGLAGVRPVSFGPVAPEDALILGADLPGPHALAVAPDGAWWSWGEPYCPCAFPGAVIEEAWTVEWAV